MHTVPQGSEFEDDVPPPAFAHYIPTALGDVNVPAYIVDRNAKIRWLNRAARALAGNAVGQTFESVLVPGDAKRARPIFERNVRGERHGDYSVGVVGADGTQVRVQISSVALGPAHHAVGMFGLAVPVPAARPAATVDDRLTPRQHEILGLLAAGRSTEQIAEQLVLSRETVRNHVRHILQRLGVNSRLEAVAVARRDGIV